MRTHLLLSTLLMIILCAGPSAPQTAVQTATRDPAALTLAAQSLQALTGGKTVSDVTVQGSATYIAGPDADNGVATFAALLGTGASTTLGLSSGQHRDILNQSSLPPQGAWSGSDGVWQPVAFHNCWVPAAWFAPALLLEGLLNGPSVSLTYAGEETQSGAIVHHLRFWRVAQGQKPVVAAMVASWSAGDLYLDASSNVPVALGFNLHPDGDSMTNVPVQILFTNYQTVAGVNAPFRIRKYLNGTLVLDLAVSGVAVNTGLTQSDFAVAGTGD